MPVWRKMDWLMKQQLYKINFFYKSFQHLEIVLSLVLQTYIFWWINWWKTVIVLCSFQIRYAAEDALSGIHILIKILDCYWQPSSLTLYIAPEAYWYQEVQSALQRMCHQWIDRKFTDVKADFAPSKMVYLNMIVIFSYWCMGNVIIKHPLRVKS